MVTLPGLLLNSRNISLSSMVVFSRTRVAPWVWCLSVCLLKSRLISVLLYRIGWSSSI